MRWLLLVLFLLSSVFAQSIRDSEAFNQGKEWGERGRQQWGGKENLKNKLQDPINKGGDLVDILGNRHRVDRGVICQNADPSSLRSVLQVTVSGYNQVSLRWSSTGNGTLDRSYSYSGRFLCLDPPSVCNSLSPFTSTTSCTVFNMSNGNITTSTTTSPPGGCYDSQQSMLIDATSLARSFSSLLFNDYRSRNIRVEFAKIEESGSGSPSGSVTATVFGGEFRDCNNNAQVNRMSEYQKNPYRLREDAFAFYLLCNPDDPDQNKAVACRTLRVMDATGEVDKNSPTGRRTCSISRDVSINPSSGGQDQLVCQPGTKVYFNGYTESNPYCVAGNDPSRFFNLHVSFWLECNKDGKGYNLKGWAYWEGAPCGSASYFPPSLVQINYPVNISGSQPRTRVGTLSVNRRRGGEGLSSSDRVTPQEAQCVSEVPTPWEVYLTVNGTTQDQPVSINVDIPAIRNLGSPWSSCSSFTFNGRLTLPGERFSGNCSGMENCKLLNEWFVDANGRRYQVLKDGEAVSTYKTCRESVYNNLNKSYTSSSQTAQSPPENCAGIPKTCRTVGSSTECRVWWRIDREYDCANTRTIQSVDTSTYAHTLENTTYNPSTGVLSVPYMSGSESRVTDVNVGTYQRDANCSSLEDRYCIVRRLSSEGKPKYEMDTVKCEQSGNTYVCPVGNGRQVEPCKCGADLKQGFNYAVSILGIIDQALKDRSCEP